VVFASEEKNLARKPVVAAKPPHGREPNPPRRRLPF
jgi:hypothetical protein